ncbi:MAG: efflux transporter outer membrane subunit [Sphingobium sp.]|nr:efflux transporter outer membrane subunit [Sphingobium sp.]
MARITSSNPESNAFTAPPGASPRRCVRAFVLGPATAVALVMLSGCAVGPDPRPPSAASLHLPGDFHSPSGDAADQAALIQWWTSFGDPQLSSFVERAIAGNNNIATAQARLRAARAGVKAADGARLPTLNASTSASRSEVVNGAGFDGTNFQAGLDASWEADIFGRLARTAQAARASAQSSAASLADVQRSLAAEVALNYVDARLSQSRLAVARDNLAIQDNTLQIVKWRVDAGLASDVELQQATAQRAQTAASIPSLEQTFQSDANQLAVLLGTAPGTVTAELDPVKAVPLGPDNVEAGLPADLLSRRPDLIVAQQNLVAELARIGVAEAQLYPALRFSGSLSSSAGNLGDLGTNILGNLLGSIAAPIFQGGQLRARVEQQQATADAALSTYRQAVLVALQDVENALVAIDRTKARETQLVTAANAAREAARLANARYESGLIDFQTLLNAQQSMLSAQDSQTAARAARANASIQLFKALGGGWQPASLASAQTGTR